MMLAIRERLKPLMEKAASRARKLGTDLANDRRLDFFKKQEIQKLPESDFVMGAEEENPKICGSDQGPRLLPSVVLENRKDQFSKIYRLQMKRKGALV